jgi:hypothetical protein
VLLDCACRLELVLAALLFLYIENAFEFLKLATQPEQCQCINVLIRSRVHKCLKLTMVCYSRLVSALLEAHARGFLAARAPPLDIDTDIYPNSGSDHTRVPIFIPCVRRYYKKLQHRDIRPVRFQSLIALEILVADAPPDLGPRGHEVLIFDSGGRPSPDRIVTRFA